MTGARLSPIHTRPTFSIARSLLLPLAFGALVLFSNRCPAEEPPHLDFVRGLRARGMPDLALEYLQKLSQKPPAGLAAVLPLELAKTRLELATLKPDPAGRAAEQIQARTELERFVKNNPQHPLAADASVEIARIAALQGMGQLTAARQQEEKSSRQAALLRARLQFEDAGKQPASAMKQIDVLLAGSAVSTQAQSE